MNFRPQLIIMNRPHAPLPPAGYAITVAAKMIGIPYRRLKKAIELDQVHVVELGGIKRISMAEIRRIAALYDLPVDEDAGRRQ